MPSRPCHKSEVGRPHVIPGLEHGHSFVALKAKFLSQSRQGREHCATESPLHQEDANSAQWQEIQDIASS